MSNQDQTLQQPTSFDVNNVVRFLTHRFRTVTAGMSRDNSRGSQLYKLQVEFAYFVDEITRGPSYQVGKIIADANTFISSIQPQSA